MRSVPFEFSGTTYALSFTAEALFRVYEKTGETGDILGALHAMENTVEGWKNACWLGALLAAQGELQRRYMGEDPRPMLSAEELRRTASPRDMLDLRTAMQQAIHLGLTRENIPDEDAEVDVVLAERRALEKKTRALLSSVRGGLQTALASFISRSGSSSS